jgi:hypothetical protein
LPYSKQFAAASRKYRPSTIKLLFIAEAPPAYRFHRFFYFTGLKNGDTLFLEMMKVLYPDLVGFCEENTALYQAQAVRLQKESLLGHFVQDGFYLIDAVEEPMPDGAGIAVKTRLMREALPALRRKVRRLSPARNIPILLIGKLTYTVCLETLRQDGFHILNDESIHHPARGNQTRFRPKLRRLLQRMTKALPANGRSIQQQQYR